MHQHKLTSVFAAALIKVITLNTDEKFAQLINR